MGWDGMGWKQLTEPATDESELYASIEGRAGEG